MARLRFSASSVAVSVLLTSLLGATGSGAVASAASPVGSSAASPVGSSAPAAPRGSARATTVLTTPTTSPGRYVRNLDGGPGDTATMRSEGCADAQDVTDAARHVVVLDIGAQTKKHLPSPGVLLSATSRRLTYGQLVTALKAYLDGYRGCRPRSATGKITVAVATNSDGDFTTYRPKAKGADWAKKVIAPLRAHAAGTHITVAGANDIEAAFAATKREARVWVRSYLKHVSGKLVYIGSADGCPTHLGDDHTTCATVISDDPDHPRHTWSQAFYYRLTHGLSPSRLRALPQIYLGAQARQWANIAITGATTTDHIRFLGPLTERAACGADCSLRPARAWAKLLDALSTYRRTSPKTLPVAVDLRIS